MEEKRKIRFTRHCRKRMELYGIDQENISKVIYDQDIEQNSEGNRTVKVGLPEEKFNKLPLKVVFVHEKEEIVVISAYPLKRKDQGVKK